MWSIYYILIYLSINGATLSTNSPTIGVITKPCAAELPNKGCIEMIDTIYIRWIEQAGGRTVPISHNNTPSYLDKMFKSINGFYITGGGNKLVKYGELTDYALTVKYILNKAIEAKAQGDYFPIWGTCLGLEILAMLVSQDIYILSQCPHHLCDQYSTYLQFVAQDSRMFQYFGDTDIYSLESMNLTFNWHTWMLTTATFNSNPYLSQFFTFLTLSYSINGQYQFISSFEAKDYPIYAIQFHPENNNFDHSMTHNRTVSMESTRVSQLFADFFVNECRKNGHHFDSPEEELKYDMNKYPTYFDPTLRLVYIIE